ncbi:hypothetical protein MSAN_02026800 [Mycena sanguinolenta]|uniref:Uncharacterized protein n=1 Tax=Mycena sanguinolenta TaxID=230812 RepID=A0A8H6XL80_9AGAR|nr:hypothetical protein MSAN_02026800 [Mycena sanguinolenta]
MFINIWNQEYPVTKPFPAKWRYGLLAFALLAIVALATTNVFLAGYDVVSVTTTNFTSAEKSLLPWAPGTTFGCEPHQFQLGDTFRTNISAFSYTIFDIELGNTSTSASLQGGFLYRNEDLSSCDVIQYEIEVKPGDRLITPSLLPLSSDSNHPILGSLSAAAFPEDSLGRAITDGMRNITNEAYWDIYSMAYATISPMPEMMYKVLAEGQPSCDPDPPFYCHIPDFSMYNAIGVTDLSVNSSNTSIQAHVSNLVNVITVFYAAVRLDLGHWTADNLFTNVTSFTNSLQPFDIGQDNGFSESSRDFPQYCLFKRHGIPYICNVMRRKPTGSFIVSVLSATSSMFLAAWGVLLAVLSRIARKQPGAKNELDTKFDPLLHPKDDEV